MDAALLVLTSCINNISNSSKFKHLILVFAELVSLIASSQLITNKIK